MKNKIVRTNYADELERFCSITGLSNSRAIDIAWEEFKKTKRYSQIMLGLK